MELWLKEFYGKTSKALAETYKAEAMLSILPADNWQSEYTQDLWKHGVGGLGLGR